MANTLNTITVDGVTYDAAKYEAQKAATAVKDNSALGKDAFLQLLVTQMQYQRRRTVDAAVGSLFPSKDGLCAPASGSARRV